MEPKWVVGLIQDLPIPWKEHICTCPEVSICLVMFSVNLLHFLTLFDEDSMWIDFSRLWWDGIVQCITQFVELRWHWSSQPMWNVQAFFKTLVSLNAFLCYKYFYYILPSWVHNEWSHFWMARWGTCTSGRRTHFAPVSAERRERFTILH